MIVQTRKQEQSSDTTTVSIKKDSGHLRDILMAAQDLNQVKLFTSESNHSQQTS